MEMGILPPFTLISVSRYPTTDVDLLLQLEEHEEKLKLIRPSRISC